MITYEEAVDIVENHKKPNEKIFGAVQTKEEYIFNVNTEEHNDDKDYFNPLEYGRTVNKETGKLGFITFEDYIDAVDENRISNIELES